MLIVWELQHCVAQIWSFDLCSVTDKTQLVPVNSCLNLPESCCRGTKWLHCNVNDTARDAISLSRPWHTIATFADGMPFLANLTTRDCLLSPPCCMICNNCLKLAADCVQHVRANVSSPAGEHDVMHKA